VKAIELPSWRSRKVFLASKVANSQTFESPLAWRRSLRPIARRYGIPDQSPRPTKFATVGLEVKRSPDRISMVVEL
jgi:hypothetical protein